MKPLDEVTRRTLKLADAVEAEAESSRAWLPEEPYWPQLRSNARAIATTLGMRLARGYAPSGQVVSRMRKTRFGVRPLAVWSPLDRIVYRALTDRILEDVTELDQSSSAYIAFVNGPIEQAMARRSETSQGLIGWRLNDTDIEYVVKTDITAFYQYIDHRVLAEQLLLITNDFAQIDALVELLGAVQGNAYGLPQMIQSSDRLADIYIQAVERSLVREGWSVSRFNDDFRIACRTYADALRAIERFSTAASNAGLVVNESKTSIVRLITYILSDTPMRASDGDDGATIMDAGMSPDELIGDYTDAVGVDDDPSDALATINSVVVASREHRERRGEDAFHVSTDPINVADPSAAEIRTLRRALNKLARLRAPGSVYQVPLLVGYVPSLMPNAVRYLASLPTGSDPHQHDVITEIVGQSLNAWQQVWMLSLVRQRRTQFDEEPAGDQIAWVVEMQKSQDVLVRAEASLTASVIKATDVPSVDQALNDAPAAVAPWYVLSLANLGADRKLLQAVAASDAVFRWLIPPEGR